MLVPAIVTIRGCSGLKVKGAYTFVPEVSLVSVTERGASAPFFLEEKMAPTRAGSRRCDDDGRGPDHEFRSSAGLASGEFAAGDGW